MTQNELRIIEFLITTNATELADLPDWLLHIIDADQAGDVNHELITTASLMFIRRERPGIGYGAARRLLATYAADPVKRDELAERISAFRLSCCLERLKRAGRYDDVRIDDPFDPDCKISVTLTEADWAFLKSNPSESDIRLYHQTPARWSMN
jgi:hypothetical protein